MKWQSIIALLFLWLLLASSNLFAQAGWESLPNLPAQGIQRVYGFSIDSTIYVGGGRNFQNNTPDFYSYDPNSNSWTTLNDFPGQSRRNSFYFTIGEKGYMGAGYNGSSYLNDFWEYDPSVDTWTQLGDFPGGNYGFSVGVSDGQYGYVIGGGSTLGADFYTKKNWRYDPTTDSWTAMADFPAEARWQAYGWYFNGKIYYGGGHGVSIASYEDLYSYDITTNTWSTPLTPPPSEKVSTARAFVLEDKSYLIEGTSANLSDPDYISGNRFFSYDVVSDNWTEEQMFPGMPRRNAFATVVGSKAYYGLGYDDVTNQYFRDFNAYSAIISSTKVASPEVVTMNVYPNPLTGAQLVVEGDFHAGESVNIEIVDAQGQRKLLLKNQKVNSEITGQVQLDTNHLPVGIYFLHAVTDQGRVATLRFVKQ